jgi:hypothetical protein
MIFMPFQKATSVPREKQNKISLLRLGREPIGRGCKESRNPHRATAPATGARLPFRPKAGKRRCNLKMRRYPSFT